MIYGIGDGMLQGIMDHFQGCRIPAQNAIIHAEIIQRDLMLFQQRIKIKTGMARHIIKILERDRIG